MYEKRIAYDRDVHDYAMYIKPTGHDEFELVGFARTYHEAEITLDQLVYELMAGLYYNAKALDAGSEPNAIAADVVAGLVEPDPPIDPLPDDGPPWPGGPEDQGGRAASGNVCQSCGQASLTWFCPECNDECYDEADYYAKPILHA